MEPTAWAERLEAMLSARATASPSLADASDPDVDADADAEERDARFLRRKAAVSALTRAQLGAVHSRISALVPALEQRLEAGWGGDSAAEAAGDFAWTDVSPLTAAQMLGKLAFVAEVAAQELREPGDEAVDWYALLSIVTGGQTDGELLRRHESSESARLLDDALDARLARAIASATESDEDVLDALADALARHLRDVLVVPVDERATPPRDASQHSLYRLLREFRGVFTTAYEPFVAAPGRNAAPNAEGDAERDADRWALRVACALPLAAADVFRFAKLLTRVLRAKHPLLELQARPGASDQAADLVRRLVVNALFDTLQGTLHELLTATFRREDAFLADVAYLARESAPAAFGVREALRLDGTWSFGDGEAPSAALQALSVRADDGGHRARETEGHALERRRRRAALNEYGRALFWLDSMSTSSRAPSEKLRRLVRACREIRGAGALYYVKEWGVRCRQRGWNVTPADQGAYPAPDELEISPEDMHRLLGFMLSAAPSTNAHVYSQIAVLRIFQPLLSPADDEQREAVAALTGVVHHMMPFM